MLEPPTIAYPQPTKKNENQEITLELQDLGPLSPIESNGPGVGSSKNIAQGSGFTWHDNGRNTPDNNSVSGAGGKQSSIRELTNEDETISLIDEDLDFPEGGLKANLVVFGSFMGLIPVFGLINSPGAIEAYVSSHQLAEFSTSTVSWIFSMNVFFAFGSGIFSGAFFDRNGARPPMIIGAVFFSGGLFATGNATTVWQFILSFGLVTGFGLGMLMSPLVGVVSHYFKKNRAIATSVATTGGSIGGIIMPLLLRSLFPKVGFAWALRILAFICMFCFVFSILFSKERISNKRGNEDVNTHKPAGFIKTYIIDVFDYKSLIEVKFISCALAVALAESSLIVCSIYFPSYAIKRGFDENTSYLLLTVINTTGILGRYIPGYVADKFLGRFNVVILTLTGCVLVSFLLWLPFGYSLKVLYAYSGLYGFCSGSILSLSPVCCGQISRTDQFGKRYSTMYLIVALAMLTAIPIAGVIIGDGSIGRYNNFIIYSAMLNVGGIMCYLISRYACVGFKLCKF
ncbi:Monocarboxylate transporter [Wickerhamomyces ciferrii]|uniref:Monocarboxylate transporter n=1 Tax=Wickerhamomyces ciferrii (strain ATCC 14091 / BCRC 22168 / CBS 111 / JCM 3599 / NBRC 0793 / NRRL Y-1031 F-60-10) TaxID=1206466 RepID=K0KRV8_WICCF|nr:Monocarboxylate transporter [Wickerhamomyces ciferrii]CCH44078.1 Monocarboxylate transporter [Wickerhamomyces ciferrii]